jgi:hypothetical protein
MKTDLRKTLDSYRAKVGELRLLDLPPRRYLMVDGRGDPNTAPAYADALAALYPVAYRVKFAAKAAGHDYVVPPLEALWWADDPAAFTSRRDKTQWQWTVMLLVPDWVDDATVAAELVDPVRLETLAEGRCVQTLHVGSYDDEGPVLAELHERFIPGAGLAMTGRHHEIYLNDARRTAPERLRTILRQPVTG